MSALESYFEKLHAERSSELVLLSGHPPLSRSAGTLRPLPAERAIADSALRAMVRELVGDTHWNFFVAGGSIDVVERYPKRGRIRTVCSETQVGLSAVARLLPEDPPTCESIELSTAAMELADLEQGLVLVAGPIGSGKSTTLSALVERINERTRKLILSIENPVEQLHPNKRSVIVARQVGAHCDSFAVGIASAAAMDADVIVVSELEDQAALLAALDAAARGVLVLAGVRASGAARAIERLVSTATEDARTRVRAAIAHSLEGVIAQELLPRKGGGCVVAREILLRSAKLAGAVLDNKPGVIAAMIEAGRSTGMQPMDAALLELVERDKVDLAHARERAREKKAFMR